MDNKTDQAYLAGQYRTASNLNARILLHQRFSVNHYGWQPWIFDQLEFFPRCRILELGCGSGNLWLENLKRIPAGWEIILSDFSPGMLQQAQTNLTGQSRFHYQIVDANSLPLPFMDGYFDGVIANHMLYYVVDRSALLAEVRRILRPGGRFYTTTIGESHNRELHELIARFDASLSVWDNFHIPFTLENGTSQLSPFFNAVELRRYPDNLEMTEVEPLVDYILSNFGKKDGLEERRTELTQLVKKEMATHRGVIHISKDSGIFVCLR